MSNKKNKKKHKQHKKIRGSLTCFKKTDLEKQANKLTKGILIPDELIKLRNMAKNAFGTRARMAAQMAAVYLPISKKSREIILNHMKSFGNAIYAFKFADCFFMSYNGENQSIKLNSPKYMTSNKSKAMKCALRDCMKAFEVYFRPILNRIQNEEILQLLDDSLVGKYKDIEVALAFCLKYLYALYCYKMPAKLSNKVFEEAKKLDENISLHYVYDSILEYYVLDSTRNNKYSTISQECATYLICNKHK